MVREAGGEEGTREKNKKERDGKREQGGGDMQRGRTANRNRSKGGKTKS